MIVFVCTGNMCRSPFAEHMLRRLAEGRVEVSSAGLAALPGRMAAAASIRVAHRFGVDLAHHRTRALEERLVRTANGIYVFEQMHRANLESLFPDLAAKVHLLGTIIGAPNGEIGDPVGESDGSMTRCFEAIEQACGALLERLAI